MEPSDRVIALLEEIRDQQKAMLENQTAWVEENRQKMERADRVRDEALRQQTAMTSLYKRVLMVGAVLLAFGVTTLIYVAVVKP